MDMYDGTTGMGHMCEPKDSSHFATVQPVQPLQSIVAEGAPQLGGILIGCVSQACMGPLPLHVKAV